MTSTWLHRPGPSAACTVIGEVAQAHDGSLGMAHAFIDAIADAGADAVKFQTHIAAAESTPSEPWRTRFSPQDETRYDYWRRMEFSAQQWQGLKDHADRRGLLFLSSPFSLEAVELLHRLPVAAWKVASGEISNTPALEAMAATGLPVILSTGMSPWEEVDRAVALLRRYDVPLAVMQCTSQYPCPPEGVGLNVIDELRDRYGCAAGLSDHSAAIYAGLAAATLRAQLLEVHVTLSREMFGPDVAASISTAELRQLVEGVRAIERMLAHPVDKSRLVDGAEALRATFMKSVVLREDRPAGAVLAAEDLAIKKPGTGIAAAEFELVVGRRLRRSMRRDSLLAWDDLEPTH